MFKFKKIEKYNYEMHTFAPNETENMKRDGCNSFPDGA
jgi:hypothetical protein